MNKVLISKETLTKAKEFIVSYKEKTNSYMNTNEELYESRYWKIAHFNSKAFRKLAEVESERYYDALTIAQCRYGSDGHSIDSFLEDYYGVIFEQMTYDYQFKLLIDLYVLNATPNIKCEFNDLIENTDYYVPKYMQQIINETIPTDKVTVYRGINQYGAVNECSWTLSKDTAVWFSHRFLDKAEYEGNSKVYSMVVDKSDIMFYNNDRNEYEVYIPIDKVKAMDKIEVA